MQLRLLLREHHYNSIHDSSLIEQILLKLWICFLLLCSVLNLGITLEFNGAFLSENNHSVHTMTPGSHPASFCAV
uniref:Uncharacterized protein n=1 Tax=Macaca fascicularis TaxID=9541 RepID=Q9N002_MACFA|nr:hypothetical protein [Macaca fascicularis]